MNWNQPIYTIGLLAGIILIKDYPLGLIVMSGFLLLNDSIRSRK